MKHKQPIQLDERIHLIDGFDLDMPERTGTYVINEDQLTLIETGPSLAVPCIKKGLDDLGFSLEQVQYIIVTHVHLDHAGGAGLLLQHCPHASVIVHTRGAWHLVNPEKLAGSTRQVYGDRRFDDWFHPVVPVPGNRLMIMGEGDALDIGQNCTLQFLDTPGHARHHFSIYDPVSNGLFTGDTAGVRYKQLIDDGIDFFLPSTSPNHFDPDAMYHSIDRMRKLNLDRIYFGHFGMTEHVDQTFDQVTSWLNVFVDAGQKAAAEGKNYDALAKRLMERVQNDLSAKGVPEDHNVYTMLQVDMHVCALGMIDYFAKQQP